MAAKLDKKSIVSTSSGTEARTLYGTAFTSVEALSENYFNSEDKTAYV